MAPSDKANLPFRWSFIPQQDPKDGSINWTWKAHTQGGTLAMESARSFDTFTECMNDARARGYGGQ
jgi:hypothetical protein